MRDDEPAAASAGVPIVRTKLLAYGMGAALGGLSGACLRLLPGRRQRGPSSSSRSRSRSSRWSCWAASDRSRVVACGAIVLSVVNHYLLPGVLLGLPGAVGLEFDLPAISSGIYGAILVIVMLLRPEGARAGPPGDVARGDAALRG